MDAKFLLVAAKMLKRAARTYANMKSDHPWKWPKDWTATERYDFAHRIAIHNGENVNDAQVYAHEAAADETGPLTHAVMDYLGTLALEEVYDPEPKRLEAYQCVPSIN